MIYICFTGSPVLFPHDLSLLQNTFIIILPHSPSHLSEILLHHPQAQQFSLGTLLTTYCDTFWKETEGS